MPPHNSATHNDYTSSDLDCNDTQSNNKTLTPLNTKVSASQYIDTTNSCSDTWNQFNSYDSYDRHDQYDARSRNITPVINSLRVDIHQTDDVQDSVNINDQMVNLQHVYDNSYYNEDNYNNDDDRIDDQDAWDQNNE